MTRLVIETATAACSVAIHDGALVLAARHEVVGRGHAERLVPMIGEVLVEAGVDKPDLILVDCGPGSFTGIRVGLAAARALALAWNVPVVGYSALSLLAVTMDRDVGVAIVGGHGELFVQRFSPAPLTQVSVLRSMVPADAAVEITEALVIGSGAATLVEARGFGRAEERFPNAADACLLPEAFATLPPMPLYGRPPDAALPR